MSSKRSTTAARWGRYLLAGALLAVLVASGISAQLFATSDTPHGSSMEDADPTLYAHGDRLRPLVEETGGEKTLNIYGPGGQIIAQVARDDQGNEGVRYPLADHLGSTRAALDADGNVVARYEYAPHGEATIAGTAAAEVQYRYTGHPWDAAQGVYETPARDYDPATGRFLSVDPQRQDASPYVYAGNNPVGLVDPTGGIKVPFFVFTGFDFEAIMGRRVSYQAHSYAIALGLNAGAQQRSFSGVIFNSDRNSSIAEHHSEQMMFGIENNDGNYDRHYQYNEKMYFFVGDETPVDRMDRLEQGMRAFVEHLPHFAREVTIINFATDRSNAENITGRLEGLGMNPLLLNVSATGNIETYGRGKRYTLKKFTVGQHSYPPEDFAEYVRSVEDKFRLWNNSTPMETESSSPAVRTQGLPVSIPPSSGIEVGHLGPDALGGAGPGPPRQPTSTTNRGHWQELIPEGPPGLLEILTTFGEPRVSD